MFALFPQQLSSVLKVCLTFLLAGSLLSLSSSSSFVIIIWVKVFKNGPSKICGRQTALIKFEVIWSASASLTLNDLYDTTCMTHNRFSNFHLRLHYHTSCSYRVHKSCSYKVFSLQEFKQNDSRTSCSSSNYCTNFREKQVKKKEIKNESLCETLA